jgi:prepilin-type N-terminal cleavage/methylation domain
MQARHSRRQGGFTLVEMAVVLVILSVIGVILARWMGTTTLEHTHALQRTLLQRAEDAVLGFATIQHRLPCPDTDGDGLENCDGSAVAMLPYRTIGLPDARAARVRYGVLRRAGDSAVLADWDTSANRAADREVVLDADLAATRDRTRVLQVFLNDPDLAPAHTVEPWDNCGHLPAGAPGCDEAPQLHLNGLDFCAAIRNAAMLPPSPQHVHTRREDAPDQIAGNVAYAMAMVDPQEPAHGAASVAFQSPRRPSGGGDAPYRDKVVAVGFDQLWTRLRCGEYYAAATYAHPNIAAAARLVTPAMHNYAKQLDIMVSLGRAKVDLTNAALLDASGELVVTSAQTLDTVSEMLQTYGGWSWRAVLATTSIGTAVGGVIAAGIAVASAHVYLASAESAHAHFTRHSRCAPSRWKGSWSPTRGGPTSSAPRPNPWHAPWHRASTTATERRRACRPRPYPAPW